MFASGAMLWLSNKVNNLIRISKSKKSSPVNAGLLFYSIIEAFSLQAALFDIIREKELNEMA
jgi:hypothetical protein